ncbi:copper amine oxidase [Paenibacillus psychroresistens]|uniref:Copper amine oxidase n=1 Tax=Paenibacillus psychroresistens TaxID=1778678 RepID=A0A6B8RPE3_9BACL|nr:stalk domain-containing protein [Paenibacillus psychroresistens]QGQ97425.1 copper amine oxidase [Paenibacillus psychroresistens]
MKRIKSVVISSLLTAALVGGTSIASASISKDGVFSSKDSNQLLSSSLNVAGTGDAGTTNGEALASLFRSPQSILVAADGSIIVSDSNSQVIRKIAAGKVTTLAGASVEKDAQGFPVGGLLDGTSDLSFFNHPNGIALGVNGSIYIADTDNHAIRVIDATGTVTILAGNGVQGNVNAVGKEAKFNHPTDLAVAKDGTVYVADTLNNAIRKITADGTVTTLNAASDRKVLIASGQTIAAGDYLDGALTQAKFNEPSGIAIDAKGNLYVSDTGNQKIRYIDLASGQVTTVAGSGSYETAKINVVGDYADGDAAKAMFDSPLGITVTDEGGLLIADSLNHSIRYLYNGKVSTIAGDADQFAGEANGVERSTQFSVPTDVAVAADGTILVTDSFNNKIRSITPYQLPADLAKDDSIKVVYNGKSVVFDSKAEIKASRTMVPFRAIAEALGYEVKYTAEGQIIEMTKGTVTIKMAIGAKTVTTIEKDKADVITTIDVAPYIIAKDNRTLIPVRFFAEQVGLNVEWNQKNHTAILRN